LPQHKSMPTLVREMLVIEEQGKSAMLRAFQFTYEAVNVHGVTLKNFGSELRAAGSKLTDATLRSYMRSWQNWQKEEEKPKEKRRTPNEIYELTGMSEIRAAAATAVADAFKVTVYNARNRFLPYVHEVQRAILAQQERIAEADPTDRAGMTDPVEYGREVARAAYAELSKRERRRKETRETAGAAFSDLEHQLHAVHTDLLRSLTIARDNEWTDENQEAAGELLDKIRSLMELVSAAITGSAQVDWDAEMRKLSLA